jgi:succinate-acetate transporter protein
MTQEDVRVRGDGSSAAMAAAREELARRLELVTRVMLRPMASPMPIGFVGLAAATVVVASMNLGWISSSQRTRSPSC